MQEVQYLVAMGFMLVCMAYMITMITDMFHDQGTPA